MKNNTIDHKLNSFGISSIKFRELTLACLSLLGFTVDSEANLTNRFGKGGLLLPLKVHLQWLL